jgi:hypothetical protein
MTAPPPQREHHTLILHGRDGPLPTNQRHLPPERGNQILTTLGWTRLWWFLVLRHGSGQPPPSSGLPLPTVPPAARAILSQVVAQSIDDLLAAQNRRDDADTQHASCALLELPRLLLVDTGASHGQARCTRAPHERLLAGQPSQATCTALHRADPRTDAQRQAAPPAAFPGRHGCLSSLPWPPWALPPSKHCATYTRKRPPPLQQRTLAWPTKSVPQVCNVCSAPCPEVPFRCSMSCWPGPSSTSPNCLMHRLSASRNRGGGGSAPLPIAEVWHLLAGLCVIKGCAAGMELLKHPATKGCTDDGTLAIVPIYIPILD